MKPDPRIFDDLSRVAGGAMNVFSAFREQILNDIKARVEEVAARMDLVPREDFERLEAQVKELQKINRVTDNSNFCENAIKEGQLVPAQRTIVLEILEAIHTTPVSNFSEGDKKVAKSPVVAFKSFIGTIKQADYSEQANAQRANPASGELLSDYPNADQESVKMDKEISEYRTKNPTTTYEQAAIAVSKGAK